MSKQQRSQSHLIAVYHTYLAHDIHGSGTKSCLQSGGRCCISKAGKSGASYWCQMLKLWKMSPHILSIWSKSTNWIEKQLTQQALISETYLSLSLYLCVWGLCKVVQNSSFIFYIFNGQDHSCYSKRYNLDFYLDLDSVFLN